MSVNKFVNPAFILFIDQICVAAGGWAYWIVLTKIVSTPVVGQATTAFSLAVLASTLIQLGLEYPLLKRAMGQPNQVFATVLIIVSALVTISIPIISYLTTTLKEIYLSDLSWIIIVTFVFSSLGLVSRFSLIGVADVRKILVIDLSGTASKFLLGYFLVTAGFGAFGILLSILCQEIILTSTTLFIAGRRFGLRFGNAAYFKDVIKEALVNTPAKISKVLIISLSIVLLASAGINNGDISLFYISLMISVVVGGLASSISYMLIPASQGSKIDITAKGMRIGLSLTSLLIAGIIVSPSFILSLIGKEYTAAHNILVILAISVFPYSITAIATSGFNTRNQWSRLLVIGMVQISSFLIPFYLLVPQYGILGAAASVGIAYVSSAILSIAWLEKALIRYAMSAIGAVLVGWASGSSIILVGGPAPASIILAITVTMLALFALRITSTTEIKQIVGAIINR